MINNRGANQTPKNLVDLNDESWSRYLWDYHGSNDGATYEEELRCGDRAKNFHFIEVRWSPNRLYLSVTTQRGWDSVEVFTDKLVVKCGDLEYEGDKAREVLRCGQIRNRVLEVVRRLEVVDPSQHALRKKLLDLVGVHELQFASMWPNGILTKLAKGRRTNTFGTPPPNPARVESLWENGGIDPNNPTGAW